MAGTLSNPTHTPTQTGAQTGCDSTETTGTIYTAGRNAAQGGRFKSVADGDSQGEEDADAALIIAGAGFTWNNNQASTASPAYTVPEATLVEGTEYFVGWVHEAAAVGFDGVFSAAASENYVEGSGSYEFLAQYIGDGAPDFSHTSTGSNLLLPGHDGVYVTIPANTAPVHGARQAGGVVGRQALVDAGWVITDGGPA
jgi:hypothetical protein